MPGRDSQPSLADLAGNPETGFGHPHGFGALHHSRKRPFMATQRRFVRRRFASHAAFSRIRSSFRNPVISSLSTAFPYAKGPRAKNSPALHEGIVRSGQEIGRRIGYHQVTEFNASAPSRWPSRACQPARNGCPDRPPLSPHRRPDFFPPRARLRRETRSTPSKNLGFFSFSLLRSRDDPPLPCWTTPSEALM